MDVNKELSGVRNLDTQKHDSENTPIVATGKFGNSCFFQKIILVSNNCSIIRNNCSEQPNNCSNFYNNFLFYVK